MTSEDWRVDAAASQEFQSIYEEANESAEELDAINRTIDLDFKSQHAPKLRDLVSFYMWTHMMTMETVYLLIERELIVDEYDQERVGVFLRSSNLPDNILLDLTRKAGVIDEDLHSKLNRIRQIRNEMAHSTRSRALLDSDHLDEDSLAAEVDRAYGAFNEVQDVLE